MNVKLHIERLVLEGLPAASVRGPQLKAALETELTKLVASGGLSHELHAGGVLPGVRVPAMKVSPQTRPAQLGTQIAQAVYGGIGKAK